MKFFGPFIILMLLVSACACDEEAKPQQPQANSDTTEVDEPQDTIAPPKTPGEREAMAKETDGSGRRVSPPQQIPWENYKIKQGQHANSLRSIGLFPHDSLAFEVVFDSTVIYQTQDPGNQADWNKLMGFSDCGGHHHSNSVRVVWRFLPASGGFQLGEYYYTNGNRSFSTLGNYQIHDTIPIKIYTSNGFYQIKAGQKTGQKQRACNISFGRYSLFPYFGGDETAPQDINIFIRQTYP